MGLMPGTVTRVTASYVYVKLDSIRRIVRFKAHNLTPTGHVRQ